MAISHLLDPNVLTIRDLKLLGVAPNTVAPFVWNNGGAVALATAGTDTACTNGTVYYTGIYVGHNMTVTGGTYLIGSVGGTDKVIITLHDSLGNVVANTDTAGTTVGTAANFQSVAFTSAYSLVAGFYYMGVTFNGTTAKFRTFPIPGSKFYAGSATQTFGTTAAFTPPGTFTADKGPIGGLYT